MRPSIQNTILLWNNLIKTSYKERMFLMAHYDDWVYDRGLENEDWVHDRWGDDDDYWDDDDDYECESPNNTSIKVNEVKENKKMITKKLFNSVIYDKLEGNWICRKKLNTRQILEENEFVALDNIGDGKYMVYVQRDVQKLASIFDIDLKDVECSNLSEANETFINYKNLIAGKLGDSTLEFSNQKFSFKNGKIDFIDLYSDKQTLNTMINAVNKYYGDNTFTKMRSICKYFAINNDLSLLQNEIDENIKNRNNHKSDKYYYEKYDNEVKRLYAILTDIKNANCFSRETFAMLYIMLEKYEAKEIALEKFESLIESRKLTEEL